MSNHRFRTASLPGPSQLLIMLIYDYWLQFSESSFAGRPRRYNGVNQDPGDCKHLLSRIRLSNGFLKQWACFLFGQFERRSQTPIGRFFFFFFSFCLCASAANGGQAWAIWMSQPSPHCVRVRWVKPLVRCFSPGERIWKGLLVSCNGRLFSVAHLKFKPPLLLFLIPTGCRESWLQIGDTRATGPIVAWRGPVNVVAPWKGAALVRHLLPKKNPPPTQLVLTKWLLNG